MRADSANAEFCIGYVGLDPLTLSGRWEREEPQKSGGKPGCAGPLGVGFARMGCLLAAGYNTLTTDRKGEPPPVLLGARLARASGPRAAGPVCDD